MEKINIAEILRNCPQGMELYSPLCGDCKLYSVNDYNITIEIPDKDSLIILRHDGTYCNNGEIMLFPKGKTTWEGFIPPHEFKTGDIIVTVCASGNTWISIFKKKRSFGEIDTYADYYVNTRNNNLEYCVVNIYGAGFCAEKDIVSQRLATEEEKTKLLKAIEDKGYKWNPEKEALERFIKPKFKSGDTITPKDFKSKSRVINFILDNEYNLFGGGRIPFSDQDNWELVSNKFDINTLTPFESKVLVRDRDNDKWQPGIWGFYDKDSVNYPYRLIGNIVQYCIPYEGNEHLLGKTDDCGDYYKTWK